MSVAIKFMNTGAPIFNSRYFQDETKIWRWRWKFSKYC